MFLLLVEMRARPGAAPELAALLSGLLAVARTEPDTLIYALHRQQAELDAFVLYELYRDRAAWQTHCAGKAVQDAMRQFERLLVAPPRLVCCDTFGIGGTAFARLPGPLGDEAAKSSIGLEV